MSTARKMALRLIIFMNRLFMIKDLRGVRNE